MYTLSNKVTNSGSVGTVIRAGKIVPSLGVALAVALGFVMPSTANGTTMSQNARAMCAAAMRSGSESAMRKVKWRYPWVDTACSARFVKHRISGDDDGVTRDEPEGRAPAPAPSRAPSPAPSPPDTGCSECAGPQEPGTPEL